MIDDAQPVAEVLILGAGAAGASTALACADRGLSVALVGKSADLTDSNTAHAQGGIIGPAPDDSPQLLMSDILAAGDGLGNPEAVARLAHDGPALVQSLLIERLGVEFSRTPEGELDLTQEAAHSRRRILHCDDATGSAIASKLVAAVRAQPQIRVLTGTAVDLITLPHHSADALDVYREKECLGAYLLDPESARVRRLLAPVTVLATGGLGQVYLHTTNPEGARGDGLAMAARAGATIINAEYVQFHPTAFYHREADRILISESIRGEGGRLRTRAGRFFMKDYHARGDLAPRDVVARAIHQEMLKQGDDFVLLDLSELRVDPRERFPTIYETCLRFGVDITREPVPVVPAAHYFCGGVRVDLAGRSSMRRLYAVGEVSCTGVHGANRLASTSLLEGLLWGQQAGEDLAQLLPALEEPLYQHVRPWESAPTAEEIDPALVIQDWATIKSTTWNYAGMVRSRKRLDRAQADLSYLEHRIEQFYRENRLSDALVGLRNAIQVALIITEAAHRNRVSRGCHFRID